MINQTASTTCLFLDIGGVLLSNGWDHLARRRAAETFHLDWEELETRHRLNSATAEEGKITLAEYLNRVVFYQERPFPPAEFQEFMFAQSKPYPEMLELIVQLKAKYGLKIVVISNEARELNAYRIQRFRLERFVDCFISSCFVHLRKPDAEIFRLALDIAQVVPGQSLYLENTPMFIEVAAGLGIPGILHSDYRDTRHQLATRGLELAGCVRCSPPETPRH